MTSASTFAAMLESTNRRITPLGSLHLTVLDYARAVFRNEAMTPSAIRTN